MKIIRAIGSLPVAISLIALLLCTLIVSTTFESIHGIPFAQKTFYQATWFDLMLSLLWFNIFFATWSRWPFKKRHIGFIVTHIGILTMLIGALLSRILGVEGQLSLFEGERWNRIKQEGHEIQVNITGQPQYIFNIPPGESKRQRHLQIPNSDLSFMVHEVANDVNEQTVVLNESSELNHAVQLKLSSERINLEQNLWLIENDPNNPFSSQIQLGPASFKLEIEKDEEASTTPHLLIYQKQSLLSKINLNLTHEFPMSITDSPLEVTELLYYPNARVEGNRIVNDETEEGFNPAVELTVQDPEGQIEKHTKFLLFPNFESLHGKTSENRLDISIELDIPIPNHEDHAHSQNQPQLIIRKTLNGNWTYKSRNSQGEIIPGDLEVGKTYETGWMDMTFTIQSIFDHAKSSKEIQKNTSSSGGFTGILLSMQSEQNNESNDKHWVLPMKPAQFTKGDNEIQVEIGPRTHPIPFHLVLNDFRKVDYPGTNNAASFESDVLLIDPSRNFQIQTTISMNEPLDYAGFRIFQSSYIQDPQLGEASVFTIAKNPGIGLIYGGCILILIGVLILFYLRPWTHSSNRINNYESSRK